MDTRAEKIKILRDVSTGKVNIKEIREKYDLSGSCTVFNLIKQLIAESSQTLCVCGVSRFDMFGKVLGSKSIEELQSNLSGNERFYVLTVAKRNPVNYGRMMTNSNFFEGMDKLPEEELRFFVDIKEAPESDYYNNKFKASFLNCETIKDAVIDDITQRINQL